MMNFKSLTAFALGSVAATIEFNYDQILWETGQASGGNSARVGFSNGTGDPGTFFELAGSAVNGAFLDGGPNALVSNSIGSGVNGRYIFEARTGSINPGTPIPFEAETSVALALLGGYMGVKKFRQRQAKG